MSRERLRQLARRELNPREIADALRHIGECEECARLSTTDVAVQLDALRAPIDDEGPWHPDHAEIAAYVDRSASPAEREIVASHLEDCELCREDVADLESLRWSRPRRRAWYVSVAAAAALAAGIVLIVQRSDDRREPVLHSTSPPVAVTRPVQPLPTITTTARQPAPVTPKYANAEWDRLVRTAIETGRLPMARGIETSPDYLRGSGGDATPDIAPAGVVIDDTQPSFSWPARDGATYVVLIFEGEERVAQSPPLTQTQWAPPEPLARGRTYVWQVQATRDEQNEIIPAPPAPPATFHIVSRRDHQELLEARFGHPEDHLLLAVLAARAGLRKEALAALARAKTNIRAE